MCCLNFKFFFGCLIFFFHRWAGMPCPAAYADDFRTPWPPEHWTESLFGNCTQLNVDRKARGTQRIISRARKVDILTSLTFCRESGEMLIFTGIGMDLSAPSCIWEKKRLYLQLSEGGNCVWKCGMFGKSSSSLQKPPNKLCYLWPSLLVL